MAISGRLIRRQFVSELGLIFSFHEGDGDEGCADPDFEIHPTMPVRKATPRAGLLQLAKLVAVDLRRGEVSSGLRMVGAALSDSPETVLVVLDLLFAEVGKKRPNVVSYEIGAPDF